MFKSMFMLSAITMAATTTTTTPPTNANFCMDSLPLQPADVAIREWCADSGILVNNSVYVVTSPKSVAGRGVFAVDELEEGDPVAMIPSHVIFSSENAAAYFPETAENIRQLKSNLGMYVDMDGGKDHTKSFLFGLRSLRNAWKKIRRGRQNRRIAAMHSLQFTDLNDLWQAELTQYASSVKDVDNGNHHPWKEWMDQWSRDDPTYTLFQNQIKLNDENAIRNAADDFRKSMPFLSHDWLVAALSIRLGRWEEHQHILNLDSDDATSSMYALIGSRAATLENNNIGVIPFHDMINHSITPNLTMLNDHDGVKIFANRKIEKGEELFLSYLKWDEEMDEVNAVWALVQWGIPTPREDIVGAVGGDGTG